MGPTYCPQTSVTTYQPTPSSIPMERRPLFIWRGRPCNISNKHPQALQDSFPFLLWALFFTLKLTGHPIKISMMEKVQKQKITSPSHVPSSQPHTVQLTFRHRASCILGQAFHYSPENAFYIFH